MLYLLGTETGSAAGRQEANGRQRYSGEGFLALKLIFTYVKKYKWMVAGIILLKIAATFLELLLPYVLEHLIDDVAPAENLPQVFLWGGAMLALAVLIRFLNIWGNRSAVRVSKDAAYEIRRDLFRRSVNLSGSQMDCRP